MLKVEHVTKYYGDFLAVDDLSFEVKKGEIFGLLGVNGAGKTTTFRMIMGLLEPTEGTITLNDRKIDYDICNDIGFLTEERSLLTKLNVKEQAIFYGKLKGMSTKDILSRLDELLETFKVSDYKERKIKELSKGNQQKIQFIMAILHKPKLLILDEPFSGLDPLNIELFEKEILKMSEQGSMIIFSSHRMDHVELFCKKLAILVRGKTVLKGDLDKIKENYERKNIVIKGDVTKKELEGIDGVLGVTKVGDELVVSIKEHSIKDKVFKLVSSKKNIIKFAVEQPSLNEIFVSKVGESFEK